jgi:creatinine amidohydrolase
MSTDSSPPPLSRTLLRIAIITVFTAVCVVGAISFVHYYMNAMLARSAKEIDQPDPTQKKPFEGPDTVFMEDMTWMEVRDAMKAGKKTVLIPSGGVEQCGPYLVMGKHNYVCKVTMDAIARKLGDALVAPIIPFVPEGDIDPPTSHMRYAGTMSLTEDTYQALVREICLCCKTHGFENIVLLADSYGNQAGMEAVAKELNARWVGGKTRVYYIREYHDSGDSSLTWLAQEHGIEERPDWLHDNFAVTATLMTLGPEKVRLNERIAAGKDRINGIKLTPAENTIAWGKRVIEYRADIAVKAIRAAEKAREP